MNNLFRHIEYLLLRHDCVIVPGLGAFIATSLPARIDRVAGCIFPPYRYVMFNQAVTSDDGLLANSYARYLSLSFEEARQIMVKDVANLLDELKDKRDLNFGNIGNLSLSEENLLNFTPALRPEAIHNNFGFSSIKISVKDTVAETEKNKILSVAAPSPVTEDQDAIAVKEKVSPLKFGKRIIKFTAAFTLLTVVFLAIINYPLSHDLREHRASVVPVEALLPSVEKKTVAEKKITDSISQQVMEISVQPNATDTVKNDETLHYLIVATFKTQKEADTFAAINSSVEYPLETISSRRVTRVYVASSSDKSELLKKLNSAKMSQRFPNSWIWTSAEK